jgi:hypothetical protein
LIALTTYTKHLFRSIVEYSDIILAIIGFLTGAGIFYLSYIGIINQFIIGITLLVSSLMYLVTRSWLKETSFQNYRLSYRQKNILTLVFCVLVIVTSALWYNQTFSRPIIYFVLVSFFAGLIAVEILFLTKDDNVWPILLKIFFSSFLIRMGIWYNYPSVMGYDAFFHINMANLISTTGFVPPFEISEKYALYPIMHILIAITKIFSFIDIKDAVFFSIGIISIICTLFVFIFVNRFAGPRVGLLSTLIICITTQIIVTGITNITAGSLVLCYFLMLLFLLMDRDRRPHTLLLCLVIMFTTVITHQLSSFVVFLSLCLFAVSLLIFEHVIMKTDKKITFKLFLALFGITMIFYWIYTPLYYNASFFDGILAPFIDILTSGGLYGSEQLLTGHRYDIQFFDTFMLQTSYLILPFFGIAGIFFWLSRKDDLKFSIAFISGLLFFLVYAIPMLGIRNLLTDRWIPFLSVFLGICAAAYIISGVEIIRSHATKVITIFIIASLLSFFMIIPPAINKDNPFMAKNQTIRNQFSDNEITATGTLSQIHKGSILTDSTFASLFLVYKNDHSLENEKNFSKNMSEFGTEGQLKNESEYRGTLVVLRKSTLLEPVSLKASDLYGDSFAGRISKTSFEYFEAAKTQNLVFTNGNILGYRTTRVEY